MNSGSAAAPHRLLRGIPCLPSLDLDRTEEFYSTKLGMEQMGRYEGYLVMRRDGVVIHFWLCDDPNLPKNSSCYFITENIDSFFAEIKARGAKFGFPLRLQPYGMKEFMVIDPDGNAVRFGSIAEGQE